MELLLRAKERAHRDAEGDRADVRERISKCGGNLDHMAEELMDAFVKEAQSAPLTINFDAARYVKVAEQNQGIAADQFNANVMNLWQLALLPHSPLGDRGIRDRQDYSYANQRYDTEKWLWGFTSAPESWSNAGERPLSVGLGVFEAAHLNGVAVSLTYGSSALFLSPKLRERMTLIGKDAKVAFADLGMPKDYDASFPEWEPWKPRPAPKPTDPILQIPKLEAAGGLPYVGTFDNPLAALKTVSCSLLRRWADYVASGTDVKASSRFEYLEANIFGGVRFAEDVEKAVVNIETFSPPEDITALDLTNKTLALQTVWNKLNVTTQTSLKNSSWCGMWRLGRERNIRRLSWCIAVEISECIREVDATDDLSCLA
ncbi:unnamed protein product [Durusdinium trenchii]